VTGSGWRWGSKTGVRGFQLDTLASPSLRFNLLSNIVLAPPEGDRMRLSELLNPKAVALRLKSTNKREALAELVEVLEAAHGFESQGEILDRVMRREAMMATGIGNGVAIPHGKARSVDRMAAAVAVCPEGIDYESEDGLPVHLIFLFVSPENATTLHVRALASLSRLMKEESVRQSLREAATPEAFMAALLSAESVYSA
jgi:fructose-specific phosphotransferase system IIA component